MIVCQGYYQKFVCVLYLHDKCMILFLHTQYPTICFLYLEYRCAIVLLEA